jgi:hypothetical protein
VPAGSLVADTGVGRCGRADNGTMAWRRARSVAVLADIHGNLPALEAVLGEPEQPRTACQTLPNDQESRLIIARSLSARRVKRR